MQSIAINKAGLVVVAYTNILLYIHTTVHTYINRSSGGGMHTKGTMMSRILMIFPAPHVWYLA